MKAIVGRTYAQVVFAAIQREYAPYRHAAKRLAKDAHTTPRNAENWLAGRTSPNGEKLLHLMSECQALADEINKLVAARRAERGKD